jgi:hypothetical protein
VVIRQRSKEALGEQRKRFEFVAPDGQGEYGEIDFAAADLIEEDRCDLFNHSKPHLGKFSREPCQALRKKVRSNRGDDADRDGTADGISLFGHIAASGFEFSEDGASAREKRLTGFREAHGTAEAVEETHSQFVFEFHNLLGEGRLRNVRLLRGAAERAGFGYGAEVTKLVELQGIRFPEQKMKSTCVRPAAM